MPTEAEIIPALSFYPNNRPTGSSLIEPISEPLLLLIDSVRSKRQPAYAYIIGAQTLYLTYPHADQIARMDINYVPNDDIAMKLFKAFDAARSSGKHDVLLREAMLDAFVRITGIEPDNPGING